MSGAAVAVMVAKARKRIVRHFTQADATTPERAVAFEPGPRRIEKRMFRRLLEFGAVVETKPGLFYLDADRLDDFRASLRRRVFGVLALGTAAMAAVVALTS
ncbi:hypothetical protein BH09PSE4_BH09PSE4_23330 [soil metagenome]